MKKNAVFIAIAFLFLGLIYGAIFNCILRGQNASFLSCYVQGIFVGMLSSSIYFMIFLFYGYGYDEEYFTDSSGKSLMIVTNIIAIVCVMYGTTMFINSYNQYPITLSYAWMNIVNLLFAVVVVAKGYYDGKVLRKKK